MIVVGSGSRHAKDREYIFSTLDVLSKIMTFEKFYLGDAKGADTIMLQYAKDRDIEYDISYADWNTHGKGAGPIRNKELLDKAEEDGRKKMLVAFPHRDEVSKGTWNTIQQARDRNMRIFIFPTE
jgi:hypothetical protein